MQIKQNNNVLYFHVNKQTHHIFYVGIGKIERPYSKIKRNRYWKNTVNKYGYNIQIVKDNLSWEQAQILEIFWIKTLGRKDKNEGLLVNMTDGGDGCIGRPVSTESRIKISEGNKRKIVSNETKMKQSLNLIGNKRTLGFKHSKESIQKMIQTRTGLKRGKYKSK